MTSDPQTANAIPWPGGAAQIAGVPAETTPAELDRRLRFMAAAAVADHAATVASDPWRQLFHIQPPTGLLNDPNGLVAHDGTYHVCYQWHPFAPKHAEVLGTCDQHRSGALERSRNRTGPKSAL